MYEDLAVSPETCLQCEACMEVCPAGIPIPERLEAVVDLFAEAAG
jgi:predicted aldo/keto reductase-like oxidoreductase